jgi:hypothetical protein
VSDSTKFRGFQAPRDHGVALIEPGLDEILLAVPRNRLLLESPSLVAFGEPLSKLRCDARESLLAAAVQYTGGYCNVSKIFERSPLILAGHQPELFHPGVWFKNRVLSEVAQRTGGIGVNLIVDQDLMRTSSVRVPMSEGEDVVQARHLFFDAVSTALPWEERRVIDREQFFSFGHRIAERVTPWFGMPMIEKLWPLVLDGLENHRGNIGLAIAQARHRIERSLGWSTIELPISQLCETPSFVKFFSGICHDLVRFREVYHQSVAEYRRAHRLRSAAHPVPDLTQEGDWLEAPFWVYSTESPQRRALLLRQRDREIDFTDRQIEWPESCKPKGIKIRPRALTMTLYLRLFLGDWMIHGIGGGKYDQVTDLIIRDYFGIPPPAYGVVTATVLPPGVLRENGALTQVRGLQQQVRRLRYQPESFAEAFTVAPELVQAKKRLLGSVPPRGAKRQWQQRLTEINERLGRHLGPLERRLRDELHRSSEAAQSASIIASREWPLCHFPLRYLAELFDKLLLMQ